MKELPINKIICGDTLTELKKLPNECIDMVITSPPYYGLRKYGDYEQQIGLEETFDEFLKKILEITAELKRVLKPTGQFWLNMGDCYGGSNNGSNDYRPECSSISKNDKKYQGQKSARRLTYWGGNVEKSTLTNPERQQKMGRAGNSKCLLMMPERIATKLIDEQGFILRNKIKWCKQVLNYKEKKTKGSVMPTSVKDRFNESGEELYFFVKNKKYYSDLDSVRLPAQTFENRPDGITRAREFGYDSKYLNDYSPMPKQSGQRYNEIPKDYGKKKLIRGKNLPTVWLIGSEPHNFQKELGGEITTDHFAIFPQALLDIPIRFGCPKNGLVLDPFMGSGTTALVSKKLDRNFIGIELNKDYCKIAEKRLKQIQDKLF